MRFSSDASESVLRSITSLAELERVVLRLVALIGLEALASAANAAIDEYRLPPSADRREFHRVHALVGGTAEKALALVELAESLKKTFMPRGEAADGEP